MTFKYIQKIKIKKIKNFSWISPLKEKINTPLRLQNQQTACHDSTCSNFFFFFLNDRQTNTPVFTNVLKVQLYNWSSGVNLKSLRYETCSLMR